MNTLISDNNEYDWSFNRAHHHVVSQIEIQPSVDRVLTTLLRHSERLLAGSSIGLDVLPLWAGSRRADLKPTLGEYNDGNRRT